MEFFKKRSFLLSFFALIGSIGVFLCAIFLNGVRNEGFAGGGAVFFAAKMKRVIYNEATIHNPQGDWIPDNWDDELFSKVKNNIITNK